MIRDYGKLIVAIDRSGGFGIIVYSIVATTSNFESILMRVRSSLRHYSSLSRRERRQYQHKFLKIIRSLVNEGVLLVLDVTRQYHTLLNFINRVGERALLIVVDDYIYRPVRSKYPTLPLIPEGFLAKRSSLIRREYGMNPVVLDSLRLIADNLACYSREQIVRFNRKLEDIRKILPVTWKI